MNEFKTEIVNTKEFGKGFLKVSRVLFPIAALYIFYVLIWDKGLQNVYFKFIIAYLYLHFGYFLIKKSFIKPKKIGQLEMTDKNLNFNYNSIKEEIDYTKIEKLTLKYTGYGSMNTHSIFGNKNFLIVEIKDGEKFTFEILIRNKKQKEILKNIINTGFSDEQFEFRDMNTRCEF